MTQSLAELDQRKRKLMVERNKIIDSFWKVIFCKRRIAEIDVEINVLDEKIYAIQEPLK